MISIKEFPSGKFSDLLVLDPPNALLPEFSEKDEDILEDERFILQLKKNFFRNKINKEKITFYDISKTGRWLM